MFELGQRIQHISGSGPVYEIVKIRPEHGDAVAVSLDDVDPTLTRVIDVHNWRIVRDDLEIVVDRDYDGFFENLTRSIVRDALKRGPIKFKKIRINAGPYRSDALRVSVDPHDPDCAVFFWYSALRNGFGSFSVQDEEAAARMLVHEEEKDV